MTAATALVDLQGGRVTTDVVALVTRVASAVTRTGRYTTASGSRTWAGPDVDDLVSDFFSSPGRIFTLTTRAGTGPQADRNLRSAIETSLKRLIIDRLRAGPSGVLYKRIDRRMRSREDVQDVLPEHWSLRRYAEEPHWGGSDDVLAHAVNQVSIDPPPAWPEDSPRMPPPTTTASVDAACTAVLTTAACPVSRLTVRKIVSDRIVTHDPAHVAEVPSCTETEAPTADIVDVSAAAEAAAVFWESLSKDDRLLLPKVRVPARQLEADGFLNLKKSAIDSRQKRLEEHLIDFVSSTPDPELAVEQLLCLQDAWAAGQQAGDAP